MRRILPLLSMTMSVVIAADLPVREVVLYKHGVGYFERAGDLSAGESAKLEFKAEQMNDVLKSLTVQDTNGKVTGLRYDSSEPLARRLAEFPFNVNSEGEPSLSGFMNQLKGARIEMKIGTETISGEIVNARLIAAQERTPEKEQVVLLLDSGELRTVDLNAATSVKFADASLQDQLRRYLSVLSSARSQEKRNVYIDSADSATRHLRANYMIPTPVWKSSYRLAFRDGDPVLEGWAIVDNTTPDDWTNVNLALVSGRPISFISRLYEPKYVDRETVELAEDRYARPVVYEGGIAGGVPGGAPGGVIGGIIGSVAAPQAAPVYEMKAKSGYMSLNGNGPKDLRDAEMQVQISGQNAAAIPQRRDSASSRIEVASSGQDLGELFEYRFGKPVTVKKGESAMLPFLQEKIRAHKLLIYSDVNSNHPMNAAEIVNTTEKTLDGGPITVFDANAYAGEALVETLKAGDKRLISYGVDLGTRIGTKYDSDSANVREVHADHGILRTRYAARETQTYSIKNVDPKIKTLIIERPVREGYKVLNQKPIETTATKYRFEVKLAANSTESYPVTEEREYSDAVNINNLQTSMVLHYLENVKLSDSAKAQLQGMIAKKREIADNETAIRNTNNDIDRIVRDQDRLRQNIHTLNSVSGQQEQVQKYARTLSVQEGELVRLRDRQDELTKRKGALESELTTMIEKMQF